MLNYDVIVIGAGHAGVEAAHASAKLGCNTLLLTLELDAIGKLSCNPAVGGIAKGHLVREVDSLGGLIGKITDACALSYRYLNRSKGKAVWATRAQVDSQLYPKVSRVFLEAQANLKIFQAKVKDILVKNNKVVGIVTNFGQVFIAKAVIVCAGTFLKSLIHIGLDSFPGGRLNEESSDDLFNSLKKLKITTKHFKTGTCARIDKRSIDFSKMTEQIGDSDVAPFSFTNNSIVSDQLSCYITYTNKKTHKIILKSLKYSALYSGKIKAKGVRYCPSLEDKIVKFADKDQHHIFIEPMARDSLEIYPNGIAVSLPLEVQKEFIATIPGLEKAVILKPGYGIEHGLIDSCQLYPTMELKKIKGLYFAGQVNGTTGYEEAAAQGLVAGINAALKIKKEKPFVLGREQAFIGVLIDDLTLKGAQEPYRMFTSRSELRLSLRESNSFFRLAPLGIKLGLLDNKVKDLVEEKTKLISSQIQKLKNTKERVEHGKVSLFDILKRPNQTYQAIEKNLDQRITDINCAHEVEILVKYEGFLRRENAWLKEMNNLDKIKLPKVDFSKISSLSGEVKEKLNQFKPQTLGAALKISGITPAAVANIYTYLNRKPK